MHKMLIQLPTHPRQFFIIASHPIFTGMILCEINCWFMWFYHISRWKWAIVNFVNVLRHFWICSKLLDKWARGKAVENQKSPNTRLLWYESLLNKESRFGFPCPRVQVFFPSTSYLSIFKTCMLNVFGPLWFQADSKKILEDVLEHQWSMIEWKCNAAFLTTLPTRT